MTSESVAPSTSSSQKILARTHSASLDEDACKEKASDVALPILVSDETHGSGALLKKTKLSAVNLTDSPDRKGNPPYIMCNEQGQAETIAQLASLNWEGGGHIGFSGWFNFDILAATRPKQALICDINPRMIAFYEVFQKILLSSETREAFLSALQQHLLNEGDYYDNGYLFQLDGELGRDGGWLSTQAGYAFVKELHEQEKVVYRDINAAADLSEFTAIEQQFAVPQFTTVYSSNIYEWLEQSGEETRERFLKNMGCLLQRGGVYVDAFYPNLAKNGMIKKKGSGPPLRVTLNDLPSFKRTKQ